MNKNQLIFRLLFAFCAFVFMQQHSFAQSYTWGASFGPSGGENITGVATDAAGNVYVTGFYVGYMTIGATTLSPFGTSTSDIYIAKYTSAGVISWLKGVGGTESDYATDIAVDASGNVTVVGSFQSTVDFNPSTTAVANLSSPSQYDADGFVLRLNNAGNFVWAKAFSGQNYDQANNVGLDASGNVYVGGVFSSVLDANPGVGVNSLTSAGFEDAFLVKLNSLGNYMWSLSVGTANSDLISDVSVDGSGNVAATGSSGTYQFVMKANAAGVVQWNKNLEGKNFYSLDDVAFDPWGNIFIGGSYSDSLDIDLGAGVNYFHETDIYHGTNMYIIKLNGSGNTLWGRQTYNANNYMVTPETLAGLAVDAAGSVYIIGTCGGGVSALFNDPNLPYPNNTQLNLSLYDGPRSAFVAKYGKEGNFGNSFQWSAYTTGNDQSASAISVDASGNIYTVGTFDVSRSINPFLNNPVTAYGSADAFLAKFAPPCVLVEAGYGYMICPNVPGLYGNSSSSYPIGVDNVGGMTYEWSPANGLSNPYIATPIASPTVTTTYTLTVTNALTGCTGTDMVYVGVSNPLPAYQAGIDKTACIGDSILIGSVLDSTYSCSYFAGSIYANVYSPYPGSANYLANGTAVVFGTAPGTYPIYLDINNGNGCYAKDTVMVTFLPTPTANAGPDVSLCAGASATIGTAALAGNTYAWSPATGLSATNVAMPIANPSSTTTYKLTVSNGSACVSEDEVKVTVNPIPVANAGADKVKCGTVGVQIGTTPGLGVNYSWTPSTGLNSATAAQPTASPTVATTYIMKVTNATTGCFKRDTVVVTLGTLPTANAGTDKSICKGTSVIVGGASTAGMNYSWYPNTASTITASVSPTATINYYLTVTNPTTGCKKTDEVKVTVKPLPVVNAGADLTTCSGVPIYIGTAAISGQTYAWSPSTGLNSATTAKPLATRSVTTTPATYSYIVTATKNLCTAKDTMLLTVNNLPAANAGIDKTICGGTPTALGAAGIAGNLYEWTPTTTPFVANPTVSPTVNTTYIVTVTNATSGCTKKDTAVFTVNAKPVANAGTDKWLANCNAVAIGATAVSGVTYTWTPSTGLSNAAISNPTASPAGMAANSLRVYTVTASKVYGTMTCTATDAMDFHSPTVACASPQSLTGDNGQSNGQIESAKPIENILSTAGVSIYPNPFANELNVVSQAAISGNYHISIVNALGQSVYDNQFNMNNETLQTRIDMEKYSAGFYFLTLESNTSTITKKLIKE